MHPNLKKTLSILGIALSSAAFTLPTQAQLVNVAEILQGSGVTIVETTGFDPFTEIPVGEYQVTNNSDLDIFAFAVSNNNGVFPYTNNNALIGLWDTNTINVETWYSTIVPDADYNLVSLSSFGDFTDFFNFGDTVLLYFINDGGPIASGSATITDTFMFSPNIPYSTGVVFGTGANGNAAIAVSAVPVPAAVWLFGSGLIGLVGVARRKTAS